MTTPTHRTVFGIACILLFVACSSPPSESQARSRETSSTKLNQRLSRAAAGAGFILVTDADGKYWLIPTLGIAAVNSNKVRLQPYYGSVAVATSYGFTPREIADTLQQTVLTGGSPFSVNKSTSKHLSGQLMPTENIEIAVAAILILDHCRFVGWGFDVSGAPRRPDCRVNEHLNEGPS